MEITWYGLSCFRLVERGRIAVVTDPFSDSIGLPSPKLKADVVTISHDVPGHNYVEAVKTDPHILRGPGEYEIGGVFITGVALHDVETRRENVAYHFDYDGLTVLENFSYDNFTEADVDPIIEKVEARLKALISSLDAKRKKSPKIT